MPPDQLWHCRLTTFVLCTSSMCSMTFERFYSIIKPASFNTVTRAKIIIACIISLCTIYKFPDIFITTHRGKQCVRYGTIMDKDYGKFYYWFTFFINFFVPFILLLVMSTFIIHALRKRPILKVGMSEGQSQGHSEGQSSSDKFSFCCSL